MRFTTVLRTSYLLSACKYKKCHISRKLPLLDRFYSSVPNYDLDIQIKGKRLKNYISYIEKEYQSIINDTSKSSGSRRRELEPIVHILKERNSITEYLNNLNELDNDDEDFNKLAQQEKHELCTRIKELDDNLLLALIPKDTEEYFSNLILEVHAGVGGQEAMLFAKQIFDMYQKFAQYKGWDCTIAEHNTTDIGGIMGATALINGTSAFQYLRHEAGIHRVQRIPATEKAGRVHTSTASVIVLPQPSEIEINIDPRDLRIEVKRASGAGGQHVNKTESAVRMVHLPTGIAVECQEDRSQIKNRRTAMAKLSALLYQRKMSEQQVQEIASRKSQVKTKNRNEKIRTYNFKDDRITDHRIGVNCYNLEGFFKGEEPLNNLIEQLDEMYKIDNLLNLVNNIE